MKHGYNLMQEVEKQFGETYSVVARFLNAADCVESIIEMKDSDSAKTALSGFLTVRNLDGEVLSYRHLEAICDSMEFLVETQRRLQASYAPTIHLSLSMLHRFYE